MRGPESIILCDPGIFKFEIGVVYTSLSTPLVVYTWFDNLTLGLKILVWSAVTNNKQTYIVKNMWYKLTERVESCFQLSQFDFVILT